MLAGSPWIIPVNRVKDCFPVFYLNYNRFIGLEEGEQLDDWMETKIAQSEQTIVSVVKSFMYDEAEERMKKQDGFDLDNLIIGK